MRRQISETQLRSIVHDVIMEEVEAQALEEGWWSNMKSGMKTAFGGDVDAAKNKATGAYSGVKQAARDFGNKVSDTYSKTKRTTRL